MNTQYEKHAKQHLILLHGWGGSLKSLTPIAQYLEEHGYKTHVLEMPGHGTTPQMSEPWDTQKFAQWAKREIEEVRGLQKYILIGHSFGGKIILESVTSTMLQPEKIVLINSNGIKPKNTIKKTIWSVLSKLSTPIKNNNLLKPVKSAIYRFIIKETDYHKTENKKNIRESFKLFNEQHYDDVLKVIKVPTLIIWGSKDSQTPLWMGEFLHKNIKNSKLEIVTDTHGLPLKQPKTVADLIHTYLQQ